MQKTKLNRLVDILRSMGRVLVAYSGGVDSTFLLKVAKDILGDNVLSVTAKSEIYPEREYEQVKKFVKKFKVKHIVIHTNELSNPHFVSNPPNRCYYCKKELFTKLKQIALKEKINYVVDGTNYDDIKDFRPGMKAIKELGVRSPLKEAGLGKRDIRVLSYGMGLSIWDKPSYACLASRIPYGMMIDKNNLQMVEKSEDYLHKLGLREVRVRHYGDIARIEVAPEDIERVSSTMLREKIVKKLRKIGYRYITLDLQGYRTGSMNEILSCRQKRLQV